MKKYFVIGLLLCVLLSGCFKKPADAPETTLPTVSETAAVENTEAQTEPPVTDDWEAEDPVWVETEPETTQPSTQQGGTTSNSGTSSQPPKETQPPEETQPAPTETQPPAETEETVGSGGGIELPDDNWD